MQENGKGLLFPPHSEFYQLEAMLDIGEGDNIRCKLKQ